MPCENIMISIIIPVFNNSKDDIKRCLDSILNQSYSSYEIIIVDDGSDKHIANYLDSFNGMDNILIFHQKNHGVSAARNQGVRLSRGSYVTFVDADDFVSKSFLCDFDYLINKYGDTTDIFYGYVKCSDSPRNFKYNPGEQEMRSEKLNTSLKSQLFQHMIDLSSPYFRDGCLYVSRGPVAKIIKKDLAMKCPYDVELKQGEDAIWNLTLLSFDPCCVFARSLWYHYVYNSESVTHSFSNSLAYDLECFLYKLQKFITNDQLKINYLRKSLDLLGMVKTNYEQMKDSYTNVYGTSQLMKREPWSFAFKWKYGIKLHGKLFLKFLLIKLGIFDFAHRVYRAVLPS